MVFSSIGLTKYLIHYLLLMAVSSRAIELFNQSMPNPNTADTYHKSLNYFLEWAHKDHESLLLLSTKELQTLLEDFIFYLKQRKLQRTSIKLYLAAIGKFLTINEKDFNIKRLRLFLPEITKPSGPKAWSTEQISKMLEFADNKRMKAIIHFLSATGCRIGVISELKWKHIKPIGDDCYQVTVYEGTAHEYTTFLHPEAKVSLDDYTQERLKRGERIAEQSLVFAQQRSNKYSKNEPITVYSLGTQISRLALKAGIERKSSENGRYETSVGNGFRKRFNTILKSNSNISYAIAERLMDHKTYLEGVYLDTTNTASLFEQYKKAIPELIISNEQRDRIRIKKLEIEKSELEKSKIEIQLLKQHNVTNSDVISTLSDQVLLLTHKVEELTKKQKFRN